MVRIYSPEREDGLVEWRVPGKRRPTKTTRLDAPRSEKALHERNLGPKGEDNAGQGRARSVRRTGRAGEKREGRAETNTEVPADTDVKPA